MLKRVPFSGQGNVSDFFSVKAKYGLFYKRGPNNNKERKPLLRINSFMYHLHSSQIVRAVLAWHAVLSTACREYESRLCELSSLGSASLSLKRLSNGHPAKKSKLFNSSCCIVPLYKPPVYNVFLMDNSFDKTSFSKVSPRAYYITRFAVYKNIHWLFRWGTICLNLCPRANYPDYTVLFI